MVRLDGEQPDDILAFCQLHIGDFVAEVVQHAFAMCLWELL